MFWTPAFAGVTLQVTFYGTIKISKTANQEKTFEFGTFGFVSNVGFRASNLESALSIGRFVSILGTT